GGRRPRSTPGCGCVRRGCAARDTYLSRPEVKQRRAAWRPAHEHPPASEGAGVRGSDAIVPAGGAARPPAAVIVPALNSSRTIERCMKALAAQQTEHLFEVLVVHSGEDDTCALAARAFPGVRALQLPRRALAATARNAGVRQARGDIFAFLDSDAYPAVD